MFSLVICIYILGKYCVYQEARVCVMKTVLIANMTTIRVYITKLYLLIEM